MNAYEAAYEAAYATVEDAGPPIVTPSVCW